MRAAGCGVGVGVGKGVEVGDGVTVGVVVLAGSRMGGSWVGNTSPTWHARLVRISSIRIGQIRFIAWTINEMRR
jgi:hypothetical protein